MASRPSQYPRWADDGGASVTEPSEPEKDLGWVPGNPELDYMNWLQLLAYQWLVWLAQVLRPTDLELADAPLPGGTAPVVGAGLTRTAGFFSGRAVAAGVPVPLTDVQAHVYNDSVITYWDLSRDAVWTPVEAGLADPEPAVTANSTRVYTVTTDATDITAVQDRRPDVVRYRTHSVVGTLRLALSETLNALSGVTSTDLQRRTPKLRITADGRSGATYELLATYDQNNLFVPWRVYMRLTTGEILWVRGAVLDVTDGAITWTPEATTATFIGVGATVRRWELSSLTIGVPFADTTWPTANASRLPRETRQTGFSIQIPGNGLDSAGHHFPHILHVDDGLNDYTPIHQSGTGASTLIVYAATRILGVASTEGEIRAINAAYNPTTGDWDRISAGNSALIVETATGTQSYFHSSADASSWDDIAGSPNWTARATVGNNNTFLDQVSIFAPLLVSGSPITAGGGVVPGSAPGTPAVNTLYRQLLIRAKGTIATDGAGGFSIVEAVGIESTFTLDGNRIVITLQQAMTSANYQVIANVWNTANNTGLYNAHAKPLTSTTFSIGVSGVTNADTEYDLASISANFRIDFVVLGLQ